MERIANRNAGWSCRAGARIALASTSPAPALEIGDSVKFLWPDAVGCTQFEDARESVFYSARYGRQFRQDFIDLVNGLREKGRACEFMPTMSEYQVVSKNQGGTGLFEYFCVSQPGWNSCLWVHLIGKQIGKY